MQLTIPAHDGDNLHPTPRVGTTQAVADGGAPNLQTTGGPHLHRWCVLVRLTSVCTAMHANRGPRAMQEALWVLVSSAACWADLR